MFCVATKCLDGAQRPEVSLRRMTTRTVELCVERRGMIADVCAETSGGDGA